MSNPDEHKRNVERSGTGELMESANKLPGGGSPSGASARAPETTFPQTERLLLELLATISHEFRTPLTVINGYTSTLLNRDQQLSPEEHHEFLQMIQQAGKRLEILTDRLLEIAEIEAGAFQLDYSLIDIPALALQAITRAERHVPEPLRDRFTFQLHCRDERGNQTQEVPPVKGDARSLRKMLDHLLDNAIRYSPAGGSIDVIAQPAPQEGTANAPDQPHNTPAFLEICVCDYGLGIPVEHLEHIFERFYRVDTRLTREVNGLGLGLTLCQHLVALHRGRIWAESCPDGGSAFHIWLPLEELSAIIEAGC
jgi:signal transduction histidine kinase